MLVLPRIASLLGPATGKLLSLFLTPPPQTVNSPAQPAKLATNGGPTSPSPATRSWTTVAPERLRRVTAHTAEGLSDTYRVRMHQRYLTKAADVLQSAAGDSAKGLRPNR